jgi:hypothetical protein
MLLGLVELNLGLTDFSDIFDDSIEQLIVYSFVIGHENFCWFIDLLFGVGRDTFCRLGQF